ncbi:MAG: hypothetical protein SO016_09295 [Lachnospiraceae bacterium]|nr:hypothetical protein [Robinsoniella sp.]MDY3766865.1 hypothetical protein [Lachnospiraceae bacterium]
MNLPNNERQRSLSQFMRLFWVFSYQKMPFEQEVEQYAVTGGVPKYLEFFV